MWIARNYNESLFLFHDKPYRDKNLRLTIDNTALKIIELDNSLFPDLKWEDEPIEVTLCNKVTPSLKEEIYSTILKEYGRSSHSTDVLIKLITNKVFNEIVKITQDKDTKPSDEILDKIITLANIFTGFYVFFGVTPDKCELSNKTKLRELWNSLDDICSKVEQGNWNYTDI